MNWHVVKHAGSFHAQKTTTVGFDSWTSKIVAGPFAKRAEAEAHAKAMRVAQFAASAAAWKKNQAAQPFSK